MNCLKVMLKDCDPKSVSFCDPIVSKISKHLDNWKEAYFSLAD